MIKVGKQYKVIQDSMDYFKPGDIVIALEDDDDVAYFVYADKYEEGKALDDYAYEDYYALATYEVEEI